MGVGKTFFVGNFDSYEIYEAFLAYKETNSIDELNILLKTLLMIIVLMILIISLMYYYLDLLMEINVLWFLI